MEPRLRAAVPFLSVVMREKKDAYTPYKPEVWDEYAP